MNAIANWLSQNKTAAVTFVLVPIALMFMLKAQGCGLDRIIKHPVPPDMQEVNGGEEQVSLADSPFVRESYIETVERNLRMYDMAAEDAALLFQFVNSAVTLGIEEIGTSAIPGGTILLGLLGSIGALYTRKPGTDREIREEKEASYRKGREDLMETLGSVSSVEGLRQILDEYRGSR